MLPSNVFTVVEFSIEVDVAIGKNNSKLQIITIK